jgi:hypothetical protein
MLDDILGIPEVLSSPLESQAFRAVLVGTVALPPCSL